METTDIVQLISLCKVELDARDYGINYKTRISRAWNSLVEWMTDWRIPDFIESVGNEFCNEKIGTHVSTKDLKKSQCLFACNKNVDIVSKGWVYRRRGTKG